MLAQVFEGSFCDMFYFLHYKSSVWIISYVIVLFYYEIPPDFRDLKVLRMASEAKDENPEHINLKVMGQDGNIVQFKIKKHTALKKLMATYCERAGLALQVTNFIS